MFGNTSVTEPFRIDASDQCEWRSGRFAEDEIDRTSDFVGNGHFGSFKDSSGRIHRATEIEDGTDAGDAERHVGDARTPYASKCVGHDDGHVNTESTLDVAPDASSRLVGVDRQEYGRVVGRVRQVNAGVGTDKSVVCLYDVESAAATEYSTGLLQDERHLALVTSVIRDDATFGLRNHLAGDRYHIAAYESHAACFGRHQDEVAQGVALANLGDAHEGSDDGQPHR